MTQEQIVQATNPKHVKIYLLSLQGVKNSDIAKQLGTNAGHVYNVLKDYMANPQKAEKAEAIYNQFPLNGVPVDRSETEPF
jgi:transcriptional regulator